MSFIIITYHLFVHLPWRAANRAASSSKSGTPPPPPPPPFPSSLSSFDTGAFDGGIGISGTTFAEGMFDGGKGMVGMEDPAAFSIACAAALASASY